MDNPRCFLLLVVSKLSGQTELRGVYEKQTRADKGKRKLLENDPNVIRAWIEEKEMNHVFGSFIMPYGQAGK